MLAQLFALNPANQARAFVAFWGVTGVEMPVWLLVIVAFLLGLVPTLLFHGASRWGLKRRLDHAERALADTRPTTVIDGRDTVATAPASASPPYPAP